MRSIGELPSSAALQGGVFTAAQAEADGWTYRQIRRRLDAGRWAYVAGRAMGRRPGSDQRLRSGPDQRPGPGPDPAQGWTDFQLGMAATLSLPGPVISHHTAAGLHRFPLARQVVAHVIHQHRHNPCRNIAFHRLPLDDDEVMLWSGCLQVTTPDRTALDLLATLPIDDALDLWAWVSTRKILDGADLETALDQRLGRVGTTNLRTLSRLTRGGAVSPAELLLHSILHDAGLGGWEAGVTLRDAQGVIGVVDVYFSRARLVVEVDGFRAHSSPGSFARDRRRQNRLIEAGHQMLRFTWDDLAHRRQEVITTIRRLEERARI